MNSQKIENILNLSLDASEEEREKSGILGIGYEKQSNTWEVIVKYHGNIDRFQSDEIQIEELTAGYAIVRIRENLLEAFTLLEEIEYIEKPKRLVLSTESGKQASCILQVTERDPFLSGSVILVAVIDSGIDYYSSEFRNKDGSTKIMALWDQTIQPEEDKGFYPPVGFLTGTEFGSQQINEALQKPTRNQAQQVVPSRDNSGHGTAVTGIIAGIASESNLIIVKLGNTDSLSFPRTTELMRGLKYVIDNNGGSQIDFLRVFCDMDVKEAVFWLLDFAGYQRKENEIHKRVLQYQVAEKKEEKKQFLLPVPSADNSYLYSYLENERGIRKEVIDFFVSQNLIYESQHYHNVVFRGNDKDGVTRFASMRGVFDKDGKFFKCDVAGNDKNYGFNVVNDRSCELVVFEAAIDLMSYVDIYSDYDSSKIALGMLADAPLETFLKEHGQISSIKFCLDNDGPGRKAACELTEKYYGLGIDVEDCPPPEGYKDYNEWLVGTKKKIQEIMTVKSPVKIDK